MTPAPPPSVPPNPMWAWGGQRRGAVLHQRTLNRSHRGTCGWKRAKRETEERAVGRHVGSWGGRQGEGDDHGGEWGQELEEEPGGWEERIWRGAGQGGGGGAVPPSCPSQALWPGGGQTPDPVLHTGPSCQPRSLRPQWFPRPSSGLGQGRGQQGIPSGP